MDLSNPVSAVIPSLEGRVLLALSRTEVPLSGSRIATLIPGASNPGVRSALKRLVRQGTVLAERSSHAVLYRVNREHLAWGAIEAAVDFATRVDTMLTDRLEALLVDHLGWPLAQRTTVALYGSVARGTSDDDSDVDLVLVVPGVAPHETDDRLVIELTAKVELWTGNACSVYDLTPDRLSDLVRRGDPMVESWLADAITLHGPELRTLMSGWAPR
jgi:hypothetical protein